jgi:hypothetical protein
LPPCSRDPVVALTCGVVNHVNCEFVIIKTALASTSIVIQHMIQETRTLPHSPMRTERKRGAIFHQLAGACIFLPVCRHWVSDTGQSFQPLQFWGTAGLHHCLARVVMTSTPYQNRNGVLDAIQNFGSTQHSLYFNTPSTPPLSLPPLSLSNRGLRISRHCVQAALPASQT